MDLNSAPVPLSSAEDRQRLWLMVASNTERVTALERTLPAIVQQAVRDAMPKALLSDDQHEWVELAIAKQKQQIAFRQAVIEKTLLGVIWAILAGGATIIWMVLKEYAGLHGWK